MAIILYIENWRKTYKDSNEDFKEGRLPSEGVHQANSEVSTI